MIQAGRGDYTPIFLSEIPKLFLDKIIPINIAYLMVSPPDDHGYMSLGVECVASKSALEVAEKVIVQVNENMPRTHGNTFINVSEVYKIIEHTAPLQELDCPAPTDEEKELLHLFRHSLMMNLLCNLVLVEYQMPCLLRLKEKI